MIYRRHEIAQGPNGLIYILARGVLMEHVTTVDYAKRRIDQRWEQWPQKPLGWW